MLIIKGLSDLPGFPSGVAATVGNFDGVHMGHQSLLAALNEEAARLGLPSLAVTFDPNPRHFFKRSKAGNSSDPLPPELDLTPLPRKLDLLAAQGVKATLVLPFAEALAERTAEDFTMEILHKALGARSVIAGYDCCFGKDRKGDAALLRRVARGLPPEESFAVREVPPLLIGGEVVSSTRIRKLLSEGKPEETAPLLGRYYGIEGRVVHGMGRGGPLLGFPTANLEAPGYVRPVVGVYATLAEYAGTCYQAVTNIGFNPSFADTGLTIETHLLDFDAEIYGQTLRVYFIKKLRSEEKFAGLDALKDRIAEDVRLARKILPAASAGCAPFNDSAAIKEIA